MKNNYYALIMAGGVGSRFWPVSRTEFPKQFIDFFGVGRTLIQSTYERFAKICPAENIYIVTNEIYADLIKEQLPDITDNQILTEPVMRNTAPCIAYGAMKIKQLDPDAAIVVSPADHTVAMPDEFQRVVTEGLEAVQQKDILLTLGIRPHRPDTGYGYIQYTDETLPGHKSVFKVKTFTEKPQLELAKSFVESGEFLWNAGIFIWSAASIAKAFEWHLPDMYDIFKQGAETFHTPEEHAFISRAYQLCTNISIDFGIMEKAENVYVLPADFGWSDLGTWASIHEMADKSSEGNAIIPADNVLAFDTHNCMVSVPKDKLVVLHGLNNLIVVESNNTLMICPRDEEQQVKKIVAEVKEKFGNQFI